MVTAGRIDLHQLAPAQRAALIYSQARAELAARLWNAALGDAAGTDQAVQTTGTGASNLDTLLAALGALGAPSTPFVPAHQTPEEPRISGESEPSRFSQPHTATFGTRDLGGDGAGTGDTGIAATRLGPNRQYLPGLEAAAARTGLPAPTIAAIIEAEAAKNGDGGWNAHSRNPRSSAAGLGQFLSGTWIDEAERKGSWLHQAAMERGLLDTSGKVARGAKAQLLAMRYHPTASIQVTADFAQANLRRMEQAGIRLEQDETALARAAYLGHHLGVGDAIRFLKGSLSTARAHNLLSAQIGEEPARRRIARMGDATAAHRDWLLGYIEKRVRPGRFTA